MKHLYKTALSILLAAATLFTLAGCGKKAIRYENADCFEKYMDALCGFDYEAAFGQLSSACTNAPVTVAADGGSETTVGAPETDADGKPKEYITKDEFIAKYTNIFSALGVESVSYERLSEQYKASDDMTIRYSAVYKTKNIGELKNEFEMHLVVQDGEWRVDWTPALIFPDMTWGSTVSMNTIHAKRGDILACGELLAQTVSINAIVADLDEIDDKDAFSVKAAAILSLEPADVYKILTDSKTRTAMLAKLSDDELTPDIREGIDKLDGARIIFNYDTGRVYPNGSLLAHTIGYVGYVSEEEVDSLNEDRSETDGLYTIHSIVGKSGIERAYESTLRGKDGLSVTVRDNKGDYVSTIYRKPVEHGADVHLTIDIDIQRRAEEVMDLVLWGDDTAGAVVVMSPKTGEVKALASYPSYDLNKLAITADSEYYGVISTQKNKPLQNRTTLGLYPPGSAFKIFTACAALESGKVNANYVFQGKIEDDYWTPTGYGTWIWPPIKRTKINKRSEPMNMENCLLHSDNIYFANLALMLGEEDFFSYLRRIGMEQSFPFDLSVARSTLKVKADDPDYWNLRSIAETGYGQGQVTISPIQLASMYCAFRNNGDMPVPRLAKALYSTDGVDYAPVKVFESSTWIEDAIRPETISTLLPMMKNIMSSEYNGTGRMLRARGVTAAGKTGTAEIGSDKSREISWVVCFRTDVPEEDELLVLVMLEIPTKDEYKYLKFDIARELISIDEPDAPLQPIKTEDPDD